MNGDRYLPGEFAVPHQLFSSVGVILPAVRGLLGLEAKGLSSGPGAALQISFEPNLPADWPFLRFQRYAIGDGHLSGEILQQRAQTILHLTYEEGSAASVPIRIKIAPPSPRRSHQKRSARWQAREVTMHDSGSFLRVESAPVTLRASQQLTLFVDYDGGIAIVPPTPHPEPGERTSSLKILDVQSNTQNPKCLIQLTLSGLGGRTYPLQIVSTLPHLNAGSFKLDKTDTGYVLRIPFEGLNYAVRQVCLSN